MSIKIRLFFIICILGLQSCRPKIQSVDYPYSGEVNYVGKEATGTISASTASDMVVR